MVLGKRFLIIGIMLLCAYAAAGCTVSSYRMMVGSIRHNNNSIWGNYRTFSGHIWKTARLDGGDTVVMSFSSTTKNGGTVSARLQDNGGRTLAVVDGRVREVTIPTKGTYRLRVDGKGHSGGFRLRWIINKAR